MPEVWRMMTRAEWQRWISHDAAVDFSSREKELDLVFDDVCLAHPECTDTDKNGDIRVKVLVSFTEEKGN